MTAETATFLGRFDYGDARTVSIDFKNAAGAAANPTAVTLTVKKPDGTTPLTTPTNPSVGRWEAVVEFDSPGRWDFHWQGTGAVHEAARAYAIVERSVALS